MENEGVQEGSQGRGRGGVRRGGKERWGEERVGKGRGRGERKIGGRMYGTTCGCMKFYYSLLSPVPLLPLTHRSMASSRAVRRKMITFNDVNFILSWPVT